MAEFQNIYEIRKSASQYFDWQTFLITIMSIAFGLISIYSATYDAGMSTYFFKQLIYTGIGIGIILIFMVLPERWLQAYSLAFFVFIILLLISVLIFGKTIYGTKGWFQIGSISIQPSEFAKLAALNLIATHLSRKGTDIKTFRDFGIVILILLAPFILILFEPDFGTATVLLAMFIGILFWTGFDLLMLFFVISLPVIILLSLVSPIHFVAAVSVYSIAAALMRKKIILTFATILIVFVAGYTSPLIVEHLMPHQKNRIDTFLNPDKDPLGKGYNVIQSKLAVGSGGVTGKGFLQGTQTQLRYIPKQWTDFIYCVPAEEFGFAGGVFVILLLAGIILKATKAAFDSENKYFSLLSFGIGSVFFYHTIINIGMVLGLMPVMGIPLPFMSYGGSALLVNCAFIGLLLNAFRSQKIKAQNK
ncbi:MAG: rod shape-determining protein RodA [Ignavibacteriae bacterium]|nr:rod shape-determining protein RodA [Ignavibacteriota bacterium]